MRKLALDGGQSGCRARLHTDGVESVAVPLPAIQTHRSVVEQLAERVRGVVPRGADVVCVGTTGLGSGDTAAELLALLNGRGSVVGEVRLAHDSVTSYLGGLGDGVGCAVAAGTGSIVFAVGVSTVARVDGWGHLIGDAGSGFQIGRQALNAVMRAYDGRGPATALTEVVRRDFPDLEQMYLDLQADPDRVRRVASYARATAELAASDEVAAGIVREAASELAHSAATALARVEAPADAPVCLLGNVFRGEALRQRFTADLATLRPQAPVVAATGDGLDGAARMATATGSLLGHIDIATSPAR